MSHLSPETFVDLLDGTMAETSVPHLSVCLACRKQLAELRATWQAAQAIEAPEPSPLFWDHLSARIREAVSAEPLRTRGSWWAGRWRMAAMAGAAAATVAVALTLGPLSSPPVTRGTQAPELAGAVAEPGARAAEPPIDESLGFVADLASNINWDSADSGLTAHGDADRALADMDDADRAELRRLLNEALGGRAI